MSAKKSSHSVFLLYAHRMEIDPKNLSKWLKTNGLIDRKKFAEMLGVSIKTTYQWTSGSDPVPQIYQAKIMSMIEGQPKANPYPEKNRLIFEISEERMREYEIAAAMEGMPLRQWLMNVADEAAKQNKPLPNPSAGNFFRVAEDPAEYGKGKQEK